MLGDIIRESEVFDLLHSEDAQIIVEGRNVLREAPVQGFISGDGIDRIWFDKNIRAQEALLQLKTRIDAIISQYQVSYHKLEGECLSTGEYEEIRSREERIAMMMAGEPVLKDKRESINKLTALSSYVDGLLWSLRDLMKLFKK